jgi:hypothetical protein
MVFVFSTGLGSAALAEKPRDFGTPSASRATTLLLAAPSSTQGTITNVPVCTALYDQREVVMTSDGGGNSLVAWSDYRNGNLDIYVQKLNPAGRPLWIKDGVPASKAVSTQSGPQIVSDGVGGAIVVWKDGRSGTSTDIYAQRVNASGAPMWTADGVVVCVAASDQSGPVAVADGAGGVLIAWSDSRGATSDAYAQRINGLGSPQWTADGVALCTAAAAQQDLAIASDAANGAYVAWQDQRADAAGDIYVRRVTAAGAPQGPADGLAVCVSAGAQEKPAIVLDFAGGAIVVWADRRGGSYDVYAQRLNQTSVQWTTNGVAVCSAAGDQIAPQVCLPSAIGAGNATAGGFGSAAAPPSLSSGSGHTALPAAGQTDVSMRGLISKPR